MQTMMTIGFDIAKSVFQVHSVDAEGRVQLRRKLDGVPGNALKLEEASP